MLTRIKVNQTYNLVCTNVFLCFLGSRDFRCHEILSFALLLLFSSFSRRCFELNCCEARLFWIRISIGWEFRFVERWMGRWTNKEWQSLRFVTALVFQVHHSYLINNHGSSVWKNWEGKWQNTNIHACFSKIFLFFWKVYKSTLSWCMAWIPLRSRCYLTQDSNWMLFPL